MWAVLVVAAFAASSGPAPESPAGTQARAALESRFQLMDRDRNGFITPNEAPRLAVTRCDCVATPPARPAAVPAWIQSYDEDGDLRVSAREFLARSETNVARPQ